MDHYDPLTFLIWVEDQGESINDAEPFKCLISKPDAIDEVAELYAEYYHDRRDGWESDWPVTFSVADKDRKLLGKVTVEREERPHFVVGSVWRAQS